jgi:hypothetical protein
MTKKERRNDGERQLTWQGNYAQSSEIQKTTSLEIKP